MSGSLNEGIRVLHVDDDSDLAEMTGLYLERENDDITVVIESSAEDALKRLGEDDIDCIVSDYNMPGMNGIEFLQAVREEWPDRPFILFTGRGSEEIASEAISAGVTDYLQKGRGTDQYKVLANRIGNAVGQYRAEQEIEETTKWYSTILEHSSDYVMIVDGMGEVTYVSPAIERVLGYQSDEVVGGNSFDFVHPDDTESAARTLTEVIEDPDKESSVEFRAKHDNGSWRWLETRGRNLLDDPIIDGVMVNVRDITERKERERDLERQRDRLQDLSSFISHDVKNQLTVLDGRLNLAREEFQSEHLDAATEAVDRIDEMIEKIMQLAQGGQIPSETRPIQLSSAAEECWRNVVQGDAELVVESDVKIDVDEERLRSLLENLFLNAVEHGSTGSRPQADDAVEHGSTSNQPAADDAVEHSSASNQSAADDAVEYGSASNRPEDDDVHQAGPVAANQNSKESQDVVERGGSMVTIRIGRLDDAGVSADRSSGRGPREDDASGGSTDESVGVPSERSEDEARREANRTGGGFYVEDDGPGIPEADREKLFNSGYTTSETGTGFGLAIVKEIAESHGWSVAITESESGGARFEFAGVESPQTS